MIEITLGKCNIKFSFENRVHDINVISKYNQQTYRDINNEENISHPQP